MSVSKSWSKKSSLVVGKCSCLPGVLKDTVDKRRHEVVRRAGTNMGVVLADRLDVVEKLSGGEAKLKLTKIPTRRTRGRANRAGPAMIGIMVLVSSVVNFI